MTDRDCAVALSPGKDYLSVFILENSHGKNLISGIALVLLALLFPIAGLGINMDLN